MGDVLRFPTERLQQRAVLEERRAWQTRIDWLERTPEALTLAVRDEVEANRFARAVELLAAFFGPWARNGDRAALTLAFALLARLDLPPVVQAAVQGHAVRSRGRVLGAEWWVRHHQQLT